MTNQLQVSRGAWHTRVYLWWYRNKYGASDSRKDYSNLCPYVRVVLFWAPLRAFFWDWITLTKVKSFEISSNMVTIPIFLIVLPVLSGYLSYSLKLGIFTLYVICFIGAIILSCVVVVFYATSKDGLDWWGSYVEPIGEKIRNASFSELLLDYFRSFHDRICPEIKIV